MKTTNDFIQNILLETCLDNRILGGVLEINNQEHIEILGEYLYRHGLNGQFVMEVVNNLVLREGKFPDRQAYNKNGWLVTFPSADYKNAALHKGTHYTSDPTHGNGGMNLYYKKKGKQARPVQQTTSTEPVSADSGAKPAQTAATPTSDQPATSGSDLPASTPDSSKKQTGTAPSSSSDSSLPPSSDSGQEAQPPTPSAAADGEDEPNDSGDSTTSSTAVPQPSAPSAPPTPVEPPKPSYIELSVKFARDEKNWGKTPYGDWHDEHGEKIAVTALDGQVVPINYADREFLKTFIKNSGQA
jgi:hypothetical protein